MDFLINLFLLTFSFKPRSSPSHTHTHTPMIGRKMENINWDIQHNKTFGYIQCAINIIRRRKKKTLPILFRLILLFFTSTERKKSSLTHSLTELLCWAEREGNSEFWLMVEIWLAYRKWRRERGKQEGEFLLVFFPFFLEQKQLFLFFNDCLQ